MDTFIVAVWKGLVAFYCWVHDWQDLIGAIIGGLLGIVGALIVSRGVEKREKLAALRLLQWDVLAFLTIYRNVTQLLPGDSASPPGTQITLVQRLLSYRHMLSPIFEQTVYKIDDDELVAVLKQFQGSYEIVNKFINNVENSWKQQFDLPPSNQRWPMGEFIQGKLEETRSAALLARYLLRIHEANISKTKASKPDGVDQEAIELLKARRGRVENS